MNAFSYVVFYLSELCTAGEYMLDGVCEPCEAGFYQDEEGQTSCKPCPLGQSTQDSGASSERFCTGEIYNYVLLGSIC